ncbi:MAG: hypothetical protein SGI87_02075 [Flavobacteriales bacterium]|nr:hypothetical protein [Flavobacteriales bacterium]
MLKSAPKLNSEESKVARNHMERCFPDLTRIIYDESSAEFSLIGTTQLELCECLQLINEQGFFIGVYTNPNTQLTEQSMAACNEYLFNNIRQRWMNGSSTEKDD